MGRCILGKAIDNKSSIIIILRIIMQTYKKLLNKDNKFHLPKMCDT